MLELEKQPLIPVSSGDNSSIPRIPDAFAQLSGKGLAVATKTIKHTVRVSLLPRSCINSILVNFSAAPYPLTGPSAMRYEPEASATDCRRHPSLTLPARHTAAA